MSAQSPAFPFTTADGLTHTGLTKREWFAGMALQGILANITGAGITDTADFAVQCADALIAQLERTA